jgi:hypothetical protein
MFLGDSTEKVSPLYILAKDQLTYTVFVDKSLQYDSKHHNMFHGVENN